MKVLTLTGKDFFGAGRAALRLHQGLCAIGVDAKMYVADKRSDDDTVVNIYPSFIQQNLIKLYRNLEDKTINKYSDRQKGLFSSARYGMNPLSAIKKFKPDIVHLHWINRGFMKIDFLEQIDVPVIISLHDMWTFTGGCHYTGDCTNYLNGCQQCLFLNSDKEGDQSQLNFIKKQKVYTSKKDLTIIGLSKWMAHEAKSSALLRNKHVVNLPNGINLDEFKPQNSTEFKKEQGLSTSKKLVLFGAVAALDEPRKGFAYLKEALGQLNSEKYELVIIGGDKTFEQEGFTIHNLGNINDDKLMINFLSAADVVVVPSIQENLSNVIMESLACATPVVAFKIGGNSDMISHKENGYLSELNSNELAEGIRWCTSNENLSTISKQARETVVKKFDIRNVSQQYLELYNSIINAADR